MSQSVHAGSVVPMGARVIIDQMSACHLHLLLFGLSCPHFIDVTRQLWHKAKAFSSRI